MHFTDSHLHFDDFADQGRVDEIIEAGRCANVYSMLAVGGNAIANNRALQLAKKYPETVFASAGFDRDFAGQDFDEPLFGEQLNQQEVVAIGETGLDYYYHNENAREQKKLFEKMLEAAVQTGKPVIVHSRNAKEDTLGILKEFTKSWPDSSKIPGVLHCYTEDRKFAMDLLDIGFMISFSGIISFKNAEPLRQVVKCVPLDRLLIETDAPYLAPVPHRGKQNQPAYVIHVAAVVADLCGTQLEEIARTTTINTYRFMNRPFPAPYLPV